MTARAPALLLLSRARVEWQDAAGVTSVEVVKDRVDEALAQLRPKGAKGQVAYVLVGPSLAQVQRLPGIPEILAEDEAAAVVHAHVGEFLIGVAGDDCVMAVARTGSAAVWAWAMPKVWVESVRAWLSEADVRIGAWVPASRALIDAGGSGAFALVDGHVASMVVMESGDIEVEWRQLGAAGAADDRTHSMRDVVDRARVHTRLRSAPDWLSLASPSRASRTRRRRRRRIVALLALSTCATALGVAAPTFEALRSLRVVQGALEQTRVTADDSSRATRRGRLAAVAAAWRARTASRTSLLRAVDVVSAALPDDATLEWITVDSSRIELAVLSPASERVIQALSRSGDVRSLHPTSDIVFATSSIGATAVTTAHGDARTEVERLTRTTFVIELTDAAARDTGRRRADRVAEAARP